MRTLHIKAYVFSLTLSGIVLLAACAGAPRQSQIAAQIAHSEGLTLEEKIQELVSRGASRIEVVATFGYSTGYTYDTLSYTVSNQLTSGPTKYGPPGTGTYMNYPDPGHRRNFRWVLAFNDRGSLYNYRRIPLDDAEATYVHDYFRDTMGWGNSWGPAYQTGFTALECTDTEHCWAAGGAGLVLETTDGGKSWVSHTSGTERHSRGIAYVIPSIYSVSFPDSVNGWLTGHGSKRHMGGLILHSPDGGKNWFFQIKSDSQWRPRDALWSITFNDNRQGWAVGGRGTILHTGDGGSTWVAQSSGTKAALLSVGFCNRQSGWAVGSSRTILHTSDAGKSWRSQVISADQLPSKAPEVKPFPFSSLLSNFPYYEDSLTSLSIIDCHQGWIAGDDGIILHTEDGGVTWLAQPSGTTETLNAVQFISANQGWAVGDRGVILKTIDGGKEWKPQSSGTREDLRDLSFVDADYGWIGGSYGTILHTSDGGNTWTKQCLAYACAGKAAEKFYWHPWLK